MLKRLLSVMCVVVLLLTINGLKQAADTLSRVPTCGMKEHHHSSKCYDEDGNLTCGKEEHEHTDACYQQRPSEDDMALALDVEEADIDEIGDANPDLVLDGLDLDNSLVLDEPAANVAAPNTPEKPEFSLGSGAKLSKIIKSTGLGIELEDVKDVGVVDNDGTQAGLLHIEKVDNDYVIKAAEDFNAVELGIIMSEEVVVVRLTKGDTKQSDEEETEVGNDENETPADTDEGSEPEEVGEPDADESNNLEVTLDGIQLDDMPAIDDSALVNEPAAEQGQDVDLNDSDEVAGDELDMSTSDEQSEPTNDEQSEPTSDEQSEPTSDEQSEPTSDEQAEPTADEQSEPTSDEQSEPTSDEQSEPTSDEQSEPTSDEQSEPTADEQSEPTSDEQAEPTSDEQSEPTADEQSEPTSDEQSEPTSDEQSEPTTDEQSEPTSDVQSEPTSDEQSEPTSDEQSEPTSDVQSEPTSDEQTEPTADEQSEPTSDEQAEPTSDEEAEPTSDEEAEPTSDEEAEPTSDEEAEPTNDEEAEPTADEQAAPLTATFDLAGVESYPLSLVEMVSGVANEAGVEASTLPLDEWQIEYDEQLLTVEAGEADYLVTPAASFESTGIVVENGSRYELTLVNAVVADSEVAAEPEQSADAPVEIAYPAQFFEGKAGRVSVSVTAPEGAFPEGTTMEVKAVYDQNTITGIRETVDDDFTEIKSVRAVDISFWFNGQEIEPLLPINVVMSVPEIASEQSTVVVHVDDAGETSVVDTSSTSEVSVEMPATSDPEGMQSAIEEQAEQQGEENVEFSADSFSVYAIVVKETIETHYIDASGTSWKITVGYGVDAKIPTGATLRVSEVTGAEADELLQQTEEKLEDQKVTLARFFDISILSREGEVVQPEEPVEVRVEMEGNDDTVKAVHFDKKGLEVLDAEKKDEAVEFSAASFSVYGIVYTVDFHYEGVDYSIPGESQILLSELIDILNITDADGEKISVLDVKAVSFTNEHLVSVQQVSGLITYNGQADVDVGEKDFLLSSLEPFHTDEILLITMSDGEVIVVGVTDASEVSLETIAHTENAINITQTAKQSQSEYSRSGTYAVHLTYAIDNDMLPLARANNIWVYDLSDFFDDPNVPFSGFPEGLNQSGPITENNMTKGRYYISGDKIYFEMNQSYINSHTDITGTLDIVLQLDETKIGTQGSSTFTFPGSNDELTITYKAVDVTESWKSVNNTNTGTAEGGAPYVAVQQENGGYKLNYTVAVRPNAAMDTLVLQDTLGAGQTVDKSSFVIRSESGATYTVPASAVNDTSDGFSLDIASVIRATGDSVRSGVKYEVQYATTVDADKVEGNNHITNSASWEWTGGSKPSGSTDVIPRRATSVDKEVVAADGDGETALKVLTYTITVGDAQDTDVSGVKVTDWMQDYQLLDGDIVVRDASGATVHTMSGDELKWTNDLVYADSQLALFEYTFPANSNNGPYTITYTTKVPMDVGRDGQVTISNSTRTDDGGSDSTGVPVDFGTRPGPGASVDKSFVNWEGKDADDKVTASWTIDVNVAADAELPLSNVVVTEGRCYTAPANWDGNQQVDAVIDWTNITVTDKATGETVDPSSYTVDSAARTITFASLSGSVRIALEATSGAAMPEGGWFENNASLTVGDRPAGSDNDNRQYGSTTFDKQVSYDEASDVFTWTVKLNALRNEVDPDVPVYFSDLLPVGMQLLNYATGGTENPSIHIGTGGTQWQSWDQAVTVSGREIERTNITYWTDWTQTVHSDAGLNGTDYTITYKTKLTDSELASFAYDDDATKTYLNTAFYYTTSDGSADGQATREVTYAYKIVDKACGSVSKDIIDYSIDVNPRALRMNNGQEMTLVDTLITTNVDLLLDTVKIKDAAGNGVVGASAVYNDDMRTLTITVPDETHVIVTYSVIAQNLGEQTFRNRAELNGQNTWIDEDTSTRTVTEHGATVHGTGYVTLSKIDENYIVKEDGSTEPRPLQGAEFALYRQPIDFALTTQDPDTGVWGHTGNGDVKGDAIRVNRDGDSESVFTSNADGVVTFDGVVIDMYDALYYWEEVTPPTGYQLDSTKHYFVMYDSDEDEAIERANKDKADVLDDTATRSDQGIIINKVATGSAWTVVNKTDGLTVEVTKAWKDSAGADKAFEEDKTVYFKLYQVVGDGTPTVYDPAASDPDYTHDNYVSGGVWKIDYSASTHTWGTASITGLPKTVDDVACTYYVVEVNQDGSALSTRRDYAVSYKAGSNQEKEDPTEATIGRNGGIIITNRDYVEISAKKVWQDNRNADGIRPTSITLHLLQDGARMDVAYDRIVEDDGEGNWTAVWEKLPGGHTYTVEEDAIPGYAVTYEPAEGLTQAGEITVTNTDDRAQLSVVKEWVNASGEAVSAPENVSVTVFLKKNGTIIDSQVLSAPDWSYTWKLADYDETVTYTVEEDASALPNGFEQYGDTAYTNTSDNASVTDKVMDGGTAVVKNQPATPHADKTQVVVQKQWVDSEGNALPAADVANKTATVQLVKYRSEKVGTTIHYVYKNGGGPRDDDAFGQGTVTIATTNTNTRMAADTTPPSQVKSEWQVQSGDHHLAGNPYSGQSSLTFTVNGTGDVYIYFWDDPGTVTSSGTEATGGAPTFVGTVVGDTLNLTAPNFSGQFYNLPTTEEADGTTYNLFYAIEELSVEGFATEYSTDGETFVTTIGATDAVGGAGSKTITVRNTYIPVENEMGVRKDWVTADGAGWPAGATVEVQLFKTVNGGEATAVTSAELTACGSDETQNPVTLTASKPSALWNHLPLTETIEETEYEITYSVQEGTVSGVAEGSFASETVTSVDGKSTVITNTQQVNVPVEKDWATPLPDGTAWTATFELMVQKRLLLVDGVEATMNQIMAIEGVDDEGWSEAENVVDGEDNVSVTLSNAADSDTFEGLPVATTDENGNTYMLRYTVRETDLTIDGVPSLNMYSAEATNAAPDNDYAMITATNTLITVDVPVEKAWDDFSAIGSEWSAVLRLQWAPVYEGQTSATEEAFIDFVPQTEVTVSNTNPSDIFENLPKYGYDTASGRPFRYQYSIEEMSYTALDIDSGKTYTFTKSTTPGEEDTYTPTDGDRYNPFYPHDGGELSEDDSDYYIQVANYKRSTKDKKYIELNVTKTWEDEILADDEAYATFAVKYNKRTDHRDISRMSEADKTASPITVTLKGSDGTVYDTIQVQPHTGLRIGVTFKAINNRQVNLSVSGGNYQTPNTWDQQGINEHMNGDKITRWFVGKCYPDSSNAVITLSGDINDIYTAYLTDTTPGSDAGSGTATTFTLNKANHWSTSLSLLSQETVAGGDANQENVEVYEYYLEETGSNPAGYAAKFFEYATNIEDGDEYNPITASSNIEARNEPEPKLVVKKAWRGVADTTGYPSVYFTLYQCTAGAGMEQNGQTIANVNGTTFEDIELKHSDNPDEDYTWTCPITLPLRDANGKRLAYYVIETPNNGDVDGLTWSNYGYSQEQDPVTFVYSHEADSGQPIVAQLEGNNGTLIIHNKVSKYHEMDIKKQYFMVKDDGSWWNVTADMTRNVILGFKVIRRAIDWDTDEVISQRIDSYGNKQSSGWEDYGDEMLVGYGPNGEPLQNNGSNDFWLQYAGLWHWTIHDMNNSQVHGHVGLPLEGYYKKQDGTVVKAKFQYAYRETDVYKDLNRTPYPEWEWFSTIVRDRYMDENGGQVTGEFGLAFANQDGDRVANYQASNLQVVKRWLGEPTAKEVYVKVWRVDDRGTVEDFTRIVAKDVAGDYPSNHPAFGNSNWQGYMEDPSEIDTTNGWLVLKANASGDWTTTMKVHNALIRTTGEGGYYRYYAEEIGYKDKGGAVHLYEDEPEAKTELETHYTRWVGGRYGHWEVNPSTNGEDKSIDIGATGENKLQVMNAPKMDLTVKKQWFDIDGNPTTPWRDSITFQIEQVSTKWVQGAPTGETRTTNVKIGGTDTFTIYADASENKHYTVDVTDHNGRHDTYEVVTDNSATEAEAWKFYVDGLYEGYFDANLDEWHCVYTIKEVEVPKSEVTIENNGVSTPGSEVTIKNQYSETGSVKVTKAFSGIDALPEGFKITATWTGSDGVEHSIDLTTGGTQPENVTLSGDGSAENPYVWTISKIKIYPNDTPTVPVTFTESDFEDENYHVTVTGTVNGAAVDVDDEEPLITVEVFGDVINRGGFTNTYDRISGGLKVTKAVTVNGAETTGTLADGEYFFRLFEADGVTQATDKDGELVEDFSITITGGQSNTVEIDNLIPGTYKVMEINGTNPAVTLNYTQQSVTVTGDVTGGDITEIGIVTVTNNLPTTEVNADKRWIDGNDEELGNWPEDATARFGVFAGTSNTPLATVTLDGTADAVPADGDTPIGYEANKTGENGSGKAIFKNLPIKDRNGKTIVYTIREIGEPTGFINQNPEGVASGGTITNKETSQKGSLKLTKLVQVNGATPTAANSALTNGTYTFAIALEGTETTLHTVTITYTGGSITAATLDGAAVDPLPQGGYIVVSELDEGDYTITETEVSGMVTTASGGTSTSGRTVTVHVTAGQDEPVVEATATFTNNKPYVTARPEVTKTLNGKAFTGKNGAGEDVSFEFTLKAVTNGTVAGTALQTKGTNESGTVTFDDIVFTQQGPYIYQIAETGTDSDTMDYADPIYVKIVVSESNGVLTAAAPAYYSDMACTQSLASAVFNNVELTSVSVTKAWVKADGTTGNDNAAPSGGKVIFYLYQGDDQLTDKSIELDGTVDTNGETSAWVATWTGLEKYDSNGTEYVYTVQEAVNDDGEGWAGYTVTYPSNGTSATTGQSITNTQKPITAAPMATKVFTDLTKTTDDKAADAALWPQTGFSFTLDGPFASDYETRLTGTDAQKVEMPNADGCGRTAMSGSRTVTFAGITFKASGTYYFTVTESEPETKLPGVVYDTSAHHVLVTVTETAGALSAAVSYPDGGNNNDGAVVINKYDEVTAQPQAGKIISGRAWQTGDSFTFTMTAKADDHTDGENGGSTSAAVTAGKVVMPNPATATVTTSDGNNGSYVASFGNITFKEAGTYTFEITENQDAIEGLTYSQKKVYVRFAVTRDDGTGELTVTEQTYATALNDAGNTVADLVYVQTVQSFTNHYISLNVVKVVKGTSTRLNGAKFQLTRKNASGIYEKFINNGFEEITVDNVTAKKGPFTVNGSTTISGLLPGDYKLQETVAPAGYIIMTGEIFFTINADGTVMEGQRQENNGTVTYSANTSANMVTFAQKTASTDASVTVQNEAGAVLPATGGIGTTPIYVTGAALLLLAIALLIRKKRNSEVE